MQDANQLMRYNGGDSDLGHLQRILLKLDEHHFVNIVVSDTKIKAHVDSIKLAEAHWEKKAKQYTFCTHQAQ